MAQDIFAAFGGKTWNTVAMTHETTQGFKDTALIGLHIDDRPQFRLMKHGLGFRFASAHDDHATRHSLERIHSRCIGIELVKDDVALTQ